MKVRGRVLDEFVHLCCWRERVSSYKDDENGGRRSYEIEQKGEGWWAGSWMRGVFA